MKSPLEDSIHPECHVNNGLMGNCSLSKLFNTCGLTTSSISGAEVSVATPGYKKGTWQREDAIQSSCHLAYMSTCPDSVSVNRCRDNELINRYNVTILTRDHGDPLSKVSTMTATRKYYKIGFINE